MEVKISKESWHYRWLRYIGKKFRGSDFVWEDPQSICPYFWRFVLNNVYVLGLLALFISGAVVLAAPVWGGICLILGVKTFPVVMLFTIGACFWLIGLGSLVYTVYEENSYKISRKVRETTSKGFLGVCKEYLFATKNKICPIIVYEEKGSEKV